MASVGEFDYIIVGSGSAGSVLAERLSSEGASVLVLEAGGSDRRFWIKVPIGYGRTFYDERINWKYSTEPDPATKDRRSYWPRGRVIGGSSSINAMVYCRGLPVDFDGWRQLGNVGWGWNDVLPYYERTERRVDAQGNAQPGGALFVSDVSTELHPLREHFFSAARELGLPFTSDFNGPHPEGVGSYQINTRAGMRCSAADAFLRPAMRRSHVRLITQALARRVVFDGRRAAGIEFERHGQLLSARSRREVILCAGAINSPQLLQLSGVGPADLLQRLGIPVVLDQPMVGGQLQDHLGINYFYRSTEPTLNDQLAPLHGKLLAGMRYLLTRRGPLSVSVNQSGGFVRADERSQAPDMQLYFNPVTYSTAPEGKRPLMNPDPFPGFIISFQPCRPLSRGRIDIRSANPRETPLIRPNYLSEEEDIRGVIAGGRLIQRLMRTQALRRLVQEAIPPDLDGMDDEQILDDFRERCGSVFHPVGTCRMGADARHSVVDSHLRVHGLDGLRVVDASIFPTITSGNTNAPTIMVAQKAADLILADQRQKVSA
ncbi:GMC family oxidoreductase N-terminal domain-containing protein [Pseudomonas sp. PDNC002]|uniref:GMC family oxidoreductase n=1 Tax=Pseudomonas sp. PDNC002 TaxID=2811422 RepID=UPI0019666229|nr:GMC family oxidoreductase N-terminal domain-containing protein [Pseudomonas sp. PDNC002]QRY79326.1 GMC family oxidoreductase N-terminal domain-containing protein [Pseudomonas sp. PDNC002]